MANFKPSGEDSSSTATTDSDSVVLAPSSGHSPFTRAADFNHNSYLPSSIATLELSL
ncbi:hypothetical protein MJO28_008526 [Puccinia striiformis f. sp. tritici]|uniref:Uncharacterized protein n=1 Tax=Puccinia striiformis f. sp. tritici TaxID=168172 RepID=A0ACC0EE44_9BASI|nr:hypothetical protein Pst134EA_015401 [Puccinia striiformis f. sp. tritici]KAH9463317.1 hypothetical protein Pst134EA_015401 [Puccinia striiformis f. sp. tritici]KAI7949705.1 hypothetical protein MJO28_008526 [Puccinia striiformis f. sp. tritici]KAI7952795.1 hypothetical protein MJO29_008426 [Puccinia striiformis f. sp. tritici]